MEVKTEADNNDITECSQDDKPTIGMFFLHSFVCFFPDFSGVPTVGVTWCGIAMVSPLYQLSPPITKCKKVNA